VSISIVRRTITRLNPRRNHFVCTLIKILALNNEPARTSITGMTSPGSMEPRFRYTPALAAAVTPIMKLLVVVETLKGFHRLVHGKNLHRAGADAKES
jgi:hypothetical protein